MNYDDDDEITKAFLIEAKRKCIFMSWGEFDGLRVPSLEELYILRGLLDGAIAEQTKNQENSD